ncbi:Pumilio homology domain family member 6 [Psilocybe cubensis]|uniref:Pumilio homology domain family member 6 n=1 Tax=Psilocybe cubensis TaxID=181762 RepID=A0ACB8GJK7_PSICU|nr:Pumilio homology domain family member 6 [Psilocybe cubensis]KAH9475808.1 Pumilio homology domain family member 6 [Psilocybe cubensis]
MAALQKTGKKRSAPSQSGPKSKKVHVENSKADKKRSQPVTRPVVTQDSESGTEEELDEVEEPLEEDGLQEADDDQMQVDTQVEQRPKDPNAARESHKAQKIIHEQRRAAKPHSTLLVDAKKVWALARQKNIPTAERTKHIKDLMNVIRGKVTDIVFKHDASRIVQTVVKHGGQKERDEVASELKGKFKDLAQNKYSKFLVTKLIKLCPSHRASILYEFQPYVLRMLLHRESSSVLADSFELYANAYERTILLREFYGKEAGLFSLTSGSEEDKERAKKGLSGVLEGADNERRRRILGAVKDNLATIFNNSDKGAVTHAIVHRALWEYITAINTVPDESEQEKLRREIFETCQDMLAEMVHTKDGSRVVRQFLAQGGAKDRKQIMKTLKPHIERMCLDDEAQLVLFTALDVTDDTKLLAKSLVSAITTVAQKLYSSPQGRRSLLYLLLPRSRRHFTPAQIASLAETDEIRSRTSKKSPESREEEVRRAASEDLIRWVEQSGESLVREPAGCLIVTDIMLYGEGDKSEATSTLLKALSSPTIPEPHPIDLPPTSRVYKALLQGGHYNHTTGAVERVPTTSWDSSVFANQFLKIVGREATVSMCQGNGNGAFVVAELCEALIRAEASDGRRTLKAWFTDELVKEIEASEAKGKKVLLEKLALL